jgi:transmembrane sensor
MSRPSLSRLPNLLPSSLVGTLLPLGNSMNFIDSGSDGPPRSPGDGAPSPHRPARRPAASLMAGLAALSITSCFASLFATDAAKMEYVTTRIGEQRTIHLSDGFIIVNTDSRIRIRPDGPNLRVDIFRGEALFHMSHNPQRHLLVSVGDLDLRDIGTIFDVRLTDGGARVLVQEGEVELSATGLAQVRLRQNQQAVVDHRPNVLRIQTYQVPADQVERSLTWIQGKLTFRCENLGVAAAEFNRYNTLKLEVMDRATASVQIGGQFSPEEPKAFATGVATITRTIRVQEGRDSSGTPVLRLSQAVYRGHGEMPAEKCAPDSELGEP